MNNINRHFFLIDRVAAEIADRLLDIRREFATGVLCGAARLSAAHITDISRQGKIGSLVEVDLSLDPATWATTGRLVLRGGEECFPFARQSLDAAISVLNLHSVNDLPGALIQINYALKPDGLFLGAMFGGETLYELRQAFMQAEIELKGGVSPRILPFTDKPQAGALLQRAGFALPVVDSDLIEVSYPDLSTLLHDIRGMGESNVLCSRPRKSPGKSFFLRVEDYYRKHFSHSNLSGKRTENLAAVAPACGVEKDGPREPGRFPVRQKRGGDRLKASFEVIYMIGWSPHESQQKPLPRGSGQVSLEDLF